MTSTYTPAKLTRCLVIAAVVLLASYAMASPGPITYSGQDDGASNLGPWPNSAAAQAAFLAAAAGLSPVSTMTFEPPVALGYYSPILNAGPGVSIALTGPNFGDGFSGISTTTFGGLYGFNTTPGGAQWLGFPGGTATFTFTHPTEYFGFWLTGLQTIFTAQETVAYNGADGQTLNIPINVNGGAQYFGFTDAGNAFTSVTINNVSTANGADAWGIDDVSYNGASTPEPSSLLLLGSGVLGLAGVVRRKFKA
jgi:hypothetical protein